MTRLTPDQIKPGRSYRLVPHYIPVDKPYKCECGGYVVSPSGKTRGKWIIDESTVYGIDCRDGRCEM